tara:strand:+ start:468 stop:899 length:432 start_codon:yes stop_codon:yes gene_type:complete
MVNKVILIGNLGRAPELKVLDNGGAFAKFSVATNESYKDKSGEWQTNTEWHNIIIWGEAAERAEKSLEKGDRVYIEGKLTHRTWKKDEEETSRTISEIRANSVKKIGDKKSAIERGEEQAAMLASENKDADQWEDADGDALPF